jgi:hypothetical protein
MDAKLRLWQEDLKRIMMADRAGAESGEQFISCGCATSVKFSRQS